MNYIRHINFFLFLLLCVSCFSACHYSFTGASVPEHIRNIYIVPFKDNSNRGEADLSSRFTNTVVQKFIDDNTLQISSKSAADAILECTITRLDDTQSAVSGNETVATRKITISVKVIYRDLVKRSVIFDQEFSNFTAYENSGDIISQRNAAINKAIDLISQDILLGVVSNW